MPCGLTLLLRPRIIRQARRILRRAKRVWHTHRRVPTTHEGGTLHLRRKDTEWTFDSSTPSTTPSIKYIAFYNAVEHELSPVTSGHRVSLTYNLYYDDAPLPTGPLRGDGVTEEEAKPRQTLSALIENLDFLLDGGYLGFGLRYQCPIKTKSSGRTKRERRSD